MIEIDILGPREGEEEVFAIEALVFDTQLELQRAMREKKITQAQLADLLDMTPSRVSQIFSDRAPNLTLKTIARIGMALGEKFVFSRDTSGPKLTATREFSIDLKNLNRCADWTEVAANDFNHVIPASKRDIA
ncbi:helix-turn-helix transcriptional regulator [Rhodobacteraceae bacterium XHP0102]|nr:helix-turn-helix transcriptional regulator [Rhodobacteraceae bacterium XHP0102]